ncbi:hypothetical protein FSP39_023295 [Pinctada imbricata]|uniref:Uncharacterized protein n=1 Tax=Pinctada imbricata TaxID=66713 RepID=A0AA88YNB3_PINIB|nr:hypothetical protein FSP39_023295 [Pinctada imbricata]
MDDSMTPGRFIGRGTSGVTAGFGSFLLIVFLPYLHIGSYESQFAVRYKHIYFNSTWQTLAIFIITAAIFVIVYESFKRLIKLIIQRKVRWSMLILILMDVYPHYYSWWMYFNYINDGFYSQMIHQTFFSVTEFASSVAIFGIFHLYFWVPYKHPVNTDNCSCDCWDTVFKGSYESQANIRYKHIYFNATRQTYAIFVITVAIFALVYESFKRLILWIIQGQVRWSMMTLFLLDIYPHYYSWWMYFNYINDGFYRQFSHATFFAVTELISTIIIFSMCSSEAPIDHRKVLAIVSISVVHMVVGGLDQFFAQLILGHGKLYQKIRNLGFLLPDVVHVVVPLAVLRKNRTWNNMFQNYEHLKYVILTGCLIFVGKIIM